MPDPKFPETIEGQLGRRKISSAEFPDGEYHPIGDWQKESYRGVFYNNCSHMDAFAVEGGAFVVADGVSQTKAAGPLSKAFTKRVATEVSAVKNFAEFSAIFSDAKVKEMLRQVKPEYDSGVAQLIADAKRKGAEPDAHWFQQRYANLLAENVRKEGATTTLTVLFDAKEENKVYAAILGDSPVLLIDRDNQGNVVSWQFANEPGVTSSSFKNPEIDAKLASNLTPGDAGYKPNGEPGIAGHFKIVQIDKRPNRVVAAASDALTKLLINKRLPNSKSGVPDPLAVLAMTPKQLEVADDDFTFIAVNAHAAIKKTMPERVLQKAAESPEADWTAITPESAGRFAEQVEQLKANVDAAAAKVKKAMDLTVKIATALAKDPANQALLGLRERVIKANREADQQFQDLNYEYQTALTTLTGRGRVVEGPMSVDEVLERIQQGGTREERLAFLAELKRRKLKEPAPEELLTPAIQALSPYLDAETIGVVADLFDTVSSYREEDFADIFRRMQAKESCDTAVRDLFTIMYSGVENIQKRSDRSPIDPSELTKKIETLVRHLRMRYGTSVEVFTDAVNLFDGMPPREAVEFVKTGQRGIQWPGIYVTKDDRKKVLIPVRIGTE